MKLLKSFTLATIFALGLTQATSHIAQAAPENKPEHVTIGSIVKVEPRETEIYVMSEGTKYEYYFNKNTKVIGIDKSEKQFADLAEGMKVKVTAQKIGKRLDPVQVEIVE